MSKSSSVWVEIEKLKRDLQRIEEENKRLKETVTAFQTWKVKEDQEKEVIVEGFLTRLGVKSNRIGFRYLTTALMYVTEQPELACTGKLTTGLYPLVAWWHSVTPQQVEAGMRRALKSASYNPYWEELYKLPFQQIKPTVGEFLATAGMYLSHRIIQSSEEN